MTKQIYWPAANANTGALEAFCAMNDRNGDWKRGTLPHALWRAYLLDVIARWRADWASAEQVRP